MTGSGTAPTYEQALEAEMARLEQQLYYCRRALQHVRKTQIMLEQAKLAAKKPTQKKRKGAIVC